MRRFSVLAIIGLLLGGLSPAAVASSPQPPRITSGAAVLIDATSGEVLYSRSAYVRRSPASTTKLLTALVAVREGRLGQVVEVSRESAAVPGSSAHLRAGDRYTLRELLEGMLLRSGNDAAHAIATAVSPDVPRFAERMNRTALAIGARQTHFVNPHGLTAAHHYTSAADLARIAQVALRQGEVRRIVASKELTLTPQDGHGRPIRNTNSLLGSYLGADGAKTGTTNAAGKCLIASARRGDVHLIAVLLKGGDRYGDAIRLLDWGFARDGGAFVLPKGRVVGRLPDGRPLVLGRRLAGTLLDGQPLRLRVQRMSGRLPDGGLAGVAVLTRGTEPIAAAPVLTPKARLPWWFSPVRRLLPRAVDPGSLHSL
jgi:D-alanyl-D-alanine carboxypeptidase (penicillin-binding protein 5/6)